MRLSLELSLDSAAACDTFLDELRLALDRLGIQLEPRPDGRLTEDGRAIARVVRWNPPQQIDIEWIPAEWQTGGPLQLRIRLEPGAQGTRISVEQTDWGRRVGDEAQELAGWFADQAVAPLLAAMAPRQLGEWVTDRHARRPTGPQARATYRDPLYHWPNFLAILEILRLQPKDFLVEIGCGGGALLHAALKSGCRAAAIDHSPEMVRLASDVNRDSITAGRLEIRQADAGSLPFANNVFTCAVMTGVFGFIADPDQALGEIFRVLAPGGRFVLFSGTKALRGTPAAPEPIASRLHFYEDDELIALAQRAGFEQVRLEYPDWEALARQAGVPEETLALFRGEGGAQLLVAYKKAVGER